MTSVAILMDVLLVNELLMDELPGAAAVGLEVVAGGCVAVAVVEICCRHVCCEIGLFASSLFQFLVPVYPVCPSGPIIISCADYILLCILAMLAEWTFSFAICRSLQF